MNIGFPRDASVPRPAALRRLGTPVLSQQGAAAAQHPLVVSAMLEQLADGGNAVDAAIAGACTAAVVMPAACGLGGDLFAIITPADGTPISILSSGIAPRRASIDDMRAHGEDGGRLMPRQGPLAASVPGFVAGIEAMHQASGSRPIGSLMQRAVSYAADGFPVTPSLVRHIGESQERLRAEPRTAATFLPDDRIPQVGSSLRQPDLATTLGRLIDEGLGSFYTGRVARDLAAGIEAGGGLLDADDFASHEAETEAPLATEYRGFRVLETGFPTPGFVVLEALNILAGWPAATLTSEPDLAAHLMIESLKLAFADRLAFAGDPAFVSFDAGQLLTASWAAQRRAEIDPERCITTTPMAMTTAGDTTSLCCADADGTMVSLIISISRVFGSGFIAGETGVLLNSRAGDCFSLEDGHPNQFAPGKKTVHTLNCYAVTLGDGTPVLVGGTPGGDSQPQWNVQTLSALIDEGLDVQAAVEIPRWSLYPATYPFDLGHPYQVTVEGQTPEAVVTGLRRRGHDVVVAEPWTQGGAVQLIARDPDTGTYATGSDPRGEGMAVGI